MVWRESRAHLTPAFSRPWKPQREHWGGWIATFQDPDGNILQLLQLPQPATG